jgi:hypothetical protein
MYPTSSTLPHYYRSAAGCRPLGLAELVVSPGLGGLGLVTNPRCAGLVGVGQVGSNVSSGLVVVVGAALLLAGALLSYQAGKAMAPPRSNPRTWGWLGVPVGLLTGAPGLGVMGWVSNSRS